LTVSQEPTTLTARWRSARDAPFRRNRPERRMPSLWKITGVSWIIDVISKRLARIDRLA
jgi:hypothetical protein